jgi:hypothetical protein
VADLYLLCLCLQYVGNSSYVAMQTSTNYTSTTGKNVASWQAAACTTNYAVVCERPSYDYRCDTVELPPEPPASPYCEHVGTAAVLQCLSLTTAVPSRRCLRALRTCLLYTSCSMTATADSISSCGCCRPANPERHQLLPKQPDVMLPVAVCRLLLFRCGQQVHSQGRQPGQLHW